VAKRGFGSLLNGPPQPLPDDDTPVASTENRAAPDPESERPDRSAEVIDLRDEKPASPEPQQVTAAPAHAPKQGKQAPGTIRLNEQAGGELWRAYVEVKAADPFLSYRQFASTVVLDGLRAHKRHMIP
jgi:hypothetical protein